MTDEITDLKRRLARIADTPRQRPQIAIPPLAARGRRKLRVRRTCAVAGSAAAVGLILTLAATGLPRIGARPGRPASPPSRPDTGTYPDPLVRRAIFGWLPKGYVTATVMEDHQNGQHTFEAMADLDGGRGGIIDLTDFGAGPEPILGHLSGGRPAQPLPATPVNGKPAHWIAQPGDKDGGRLRWQYGPHRWAEISVLGSADDTGTIHRIAKSIMFGAAQPVAFPFRIRGLPDGLTIYRSTAGPGLGRGAGESAGVSFGAGAYSPNNGLEISVNPAGLMKRQLATDPGRRITVGGHRAVDRRTTSGGVARHTLIVLDVNGFDVTVQASGQTLQRLQTTGGVTGLYQRITVLGTAPSRWTTAPFA
ncbi:hypothetical protein [Actinoallomurus iriomotensis]|uniref:Uncharacterized protein n=1 Tax=Actinoallomurus iriomotensis TaxID=478107 RepID=A0A9W6RXS3_9ACTN|nr:hypothetical protein [Actinoallomurus iriomotensis]GLY83459.1 hypothetical protein Airi02_013890 [Actinoallomurus iriomotensis]